MKGGKGKGKGKGNKGKQKRKWKRKMKRKFFTIFGNKFRFVPQGTDPIKFFGNPPTCGIMNSGIKFHPVH
jgi:hypothetical protein